MMKWTDSCESIEFEREGMDGWMDGKNGSNRWIRQIKTGPINRWASIKRAINQPAKKPGTKPKREPNRTGPDRIVINLERAERAARLILIGQTSCPHVCYVIYNAY